MHPSVPRSTIYTTWKRPRCKSTDEWIKKLWYIYTVEYHSVIKRNETESVAVRWMNLQPIIQSEVSQKEKTKYCLLTHIYGEGNGTPLQYSCLENSKDGGAWQAAVHGVAKSRT